MLRLFLMACLWLAFPVPMLLLWLVQKGRD